MRYIFGLFITIGLIILLIILLVGGGGKPKVSKTSKTLDSYASTDAEVRMTIDGPVNGQPIHTQVRVTVDRDNVTYEQLQGYDGNVVKTQTYENTQEAYATFLLALAHAGYTKGNLDKALADERGFCPLGARYIFELNQGSHNIERFWTTSCGNPKTYEGNRGLTINLFQNQVPDYDGLTHNLVLY